MARNKKLTFIILFLLILSLPVKLFLVKQTQDNRSSAAPADKLEAEGGILANGTSVKQDSIASDGSYIESEINQTNRTFNQ